MSYVDLNPIRAKMADTPEHSDHTSIQQRIQTLLKADSNEPSTAKTEPATEPKLMALTPLREDVHKNALGFREKDYLALVDWAGRQIRPDKRGAINEAPPDLIDAPYMCVPRTVAVPWKQAYSQKT